MAEYIDRDAAKEELCDRCTNVELCTRSDNDCPVKRGLNAIPAAGVKPVVRGKWKRGAFTDVAPKGIEFFYCSECGIRYPHIEFPGNFCPNCGADMRESNNG